MHRRVGNVRTSFVLAAAVLFAASMGTRAPAHAETATLNPDADNTLYEDFLGMLSNGAGVHLFAGVTQGFQLRRALMHFDVAGAIPDGSTIDDVQLHMHISREAPGSGPADFALHRVLADWGEGTSDAGEPGGAGTDPSTGDVTWLHRFYPDVLWTTPGGDFDATPSGVATAGGGVGEYTWGSTPGMVADVQGWLDDPGDNFGWVLRDAAEDTRGTAKRLASRENEQKTYRPVLEIRYTPPPTAVERSTWGRVKTRQAAAEE
jgi:hypothetical protein